ncbi:DUF4159 domain-containing protein [Lutibacter sp.]|uniref:DUF4159 domain-containing protein n=1 Tax=Lutibacter sp. TaxID=1925666 RepID=UPI0025C27953|nr:DUF4159 domain-containing protein [Lutibacter sp.]MCF6180706.1 DUF4159 domain-containing protein [Lutibacter sp.]
MIFLKKSYFKNCIISRNKFLFLFPFILFPFSFIHAQQVASLKYNGGGDWYANPTSVPDLITFCNKNINTKIDKKLINVEVGSPAIFNYPIVFMTGHGNVLFSNEDAENLRNYLISGGFLEISDNYGLDKYIRREMKKVFPNLEFQEIPLNHPIYHQTFIFENGLPKIHEHNGKPAQAFGIFYKGRLVCFYDYESDLSDGWENKEVHHDPQQIREKALKMGANIVEYAFKN